MNDRDTQKIRDILDLSPMQLVDDWDNYRELYEWADRERSRRIRAVLDKAEGGERNDEGSAQ